MKKNIFFLVLGLIIILITTIFFFKQLADQKIDLFSFILFIINIFIAIMVGRSSVEENGVYHWEQLKEGLIFEILSIDENFESYNISETEVDVVAKIKDFGKALITLPTSPTCWINTVPKKGDRYIKIGNYFYHIS